MTKRRKFSEEFKREAVNLTRQPWIGIIGAWRPLGFGEAAKQRRAEEAFTSQGGSAFISASEGRTNPRGERPWTGIEMCQTK